MIPFLKKHFFKFLYLGVVAVLAGVFALNYVAMQAKRKKHGEEEHRKYCLDYVCPEDVIPEPYLGSKEYTVFKRAGRLYTAPRKYPSYGGAFRIEWRNEKSDYFDPEERRTKPATEQNWRLGYFEFFLITELEPPPKYGPVGYRRVEDAQQQGWITARELLRSGLERVQISHYYAEEGKILREDGTWPNSWTYIATNLKGFDGLPPTLGCTFDETGSKTGGTTFLWKPDILINVRMSNHYCADWPEIFTKIMQILSEIKEIK